MHNLSVDHNQGIHDVKDNHAHVILGPMERNEGVV